MFHLRLSLIPRTLLDTLTSRVASHPPALAAGLTVDEFKLRGSPAVLQAPSPNLLPHDSFKSGSDNRLAGSRGPETKSIYVGTEVWK